MERKFKKELISWKKDNNKKPMLLYGIVGCGKTYTVLSFGKEEYKNVIYFDCFDNLELSYVLEKNNTLEKLIRGISAISLETVLKDETLIILDRVNDNVIKIINNLFKGVSDYHVIMITNSRALFDKSKKCDFAFKQLGLVSFPEYLKFIGKEQLVDFILDSFKNGTAMPFNSIAEEVFKDYVLTGGYPEAIISFNENKSYALLDVMHTRIIDLLMDKFFEVDNLIDVKRGKELFSQVSIQLLKENKKFLYGMVRHGARSRDYERIMKFMCDNGFLVKCNKTTSLDSPISKGKDEESFKLYMYDTGLLFKKMNISYNRLSINEKLLSVIYENYVISCLQQSGFTPYYYQNSGKSLVDCVIQTKKGNIIPIEFVNNEYNTKSKSLSMVMNKYNIKYAVRFGNFNFKKKNDVQYLPYYAVFCLIDNL